MAHFINRSHLRASLRCTLWVTVLVSLVAQSGTARAATAEEHCLKARHVAMAKYTACQHKALAAYLGAAKDFSEFQQVASKCRVKLGKVWPKLQAKAAGTGSTCDNARFVDNGDGAADGTVYTGFLATLNDSGGCFAGQCDWRVPAIDELQAIYLPEPYSCTIIPCIDETLFGPAGVYFKAWTATSDATDATFAWSVLDTHLFAQFKGGSSQVRAVRGGS
jgi:hypothetical protein